MEPTAGNADTEGAPAPRKTSAKVPDKPEQGPFALGALPSIGFGMWKVAEEKSFATDRGLDELRLTSYPKDDDLIEALASETLDGAAASAHYVPMLMELNPDIDLKIVSVLDVSTDANAILSTGEVLNLSDLEGRRVAYEEGTSGEVLLRYALGEKKMTVDDILKSPMPAAKAAEALLAGRVDAAVTFEPHLSSARADDKGLRTLYTAGAKEGLISDVFIVRTKVLDERPGQLLAMLKVWDDTFNEYQRNTEATQAIVAKAVDAKPAAMTTAFEGIHYYNGVENSSYLAGPFRVGALREMIRVCREAGMLNKTWSNEAQNALIVDSFVKKL